MNYNLECIRAVLLALENELKADDLLHHYDVSLDRLFEVTREFPRGEVLFSVEQLKLAGFIEAFMEYGDGELQECIITNVTPMGYQFLSSIRKDKQLKQVAKKIATVIAKNSLQVGAALLEILPSIIKL